MERADRKFLVRDTEPAYRAPGRVAELRDRAERAQALLGECRLCPRRCGVDRLAGQLGTCGIGRRARISSAFAHFGEESCLSGVRGSGTIFLTGCNLRCVFCQNEDISHTTAGAERGPTDIVAIMLALQARGCHNINFVTPTHVVPQILAALPDALEAGLRIPLVYNTSAYDALEALRLLDGVVDIYMPDFKLWTVASGKRYLHATDYAERARAAILEMHRQVGDLRFSRGGLACRGLLVRHLVMPGLGSESAAIFEWLAREVSADTFVNVMGQYRPAHEVGDQDEASGRTRFAEIDRRVSPVEMAAAGRAARAAGLWRFD